MGSVNHKRTEKKIRPIKYIADFKIEWSNGKTEIIDVKSSREFKTQVYHLKKKIFMKRFPDLDLVEVYDDMI